MTKVSVVLEILTRVSKYTNNVYSMYKYLGLQYEELVRWKSEAQQLCFSRSALPHQIWVAAFKMGRQSFAELLALLPCDRLARNHLGILIVFHTL